MKGWLKCMRNYVNFRGRARRREFWTFTFFNALVYCILLLGCCLSVGVPAFRMDGGAVDAMESLTAYIWVICGFVVLFYLWMLATFLPGLAVRVRRLHDIGLSGKWLLGYYAFYLVCLQWMCTSILQFSEGGVLEGLSELQSAAARWIVVRPTLLAIILLSAVGIAAMCIGSQRGENRYGADPKADDRLPEKESV